MMRFEEDELDYAGALLARPLKKSSCFFQYHCKDETFKLEPV